MVCWYCGHAHVPCANCGHAPQGHAPQGQEELRFLAGSLADADVKIVELEMEIKRLKDGDS